MSMVGLDGENWPKANFRSLVFNVLKANLDENLILKEKKSPNLPLNRGIFRRYFQNLKLV